MPQEPQIEVLSYKKRVIVFWTFFLIFILAMPALIFYTSGNRLVLGEEEAAIISMGGIYLGNDLDEIDVFIDEEQVEQSRLFRRALYLEDINAGQHRVHVQAPALQTWVKELASKPGIVTESFSFNLPETAQVRIITESQTATGTALVTEASSTAAVFGHASVTNPYLVATDNRLATAEANPEYEFVRELFAATSSINSTLLERVQAQFETRFTFSSATTSNATSSVATTTVTNNNLRLAEAAAELVVEWVGEPGEQPYYFCVDLAASSSMAAAYGEHVAADVVAEVASSSQTVSVGEPYCRESIQLDRLRQDVRLFTFMPGSPDLVLLHLEDGLYVTEIDDRSWQNTQLLYPGRDFAVLMDGERIYISEAGVYFEVITTLDAAS